MPIYQSVSCYGCLKTERIKSARELPESKEQGSKLSALSLPESTEQGSKLSALSLPESTEQGSKRDHQQ